MKARSGAVSVAELVLVAWLFGLVLAAAAGFLAHQNRLAAVQHDSIRLEEAARTGVVVLGTELRYLTDADLHAAADSLRLRAVRGGGAICARDETSVWVAYRGLRQPEPQKDSVLLVGPGGEEARSLVVAGPSSLCGGSVRMTLGDGPDALAGWVLVFETGVYALSGGAIRYRRGQGGRQPLTEVVLADMAMALTPDGLRIRLGADADSLPRLAGTARDFSAYHLNRGPLP